MRWKDNSCSWLQGLIVNVYAAQRDLQIISNSLYNTKDILQNYRTRRKTIQELVQGAHTIISKKKIKKFQASHFLFLRYTIEPQQARQHCINVKRETQTNSRQWRSENKIKQQQTHIIYSQLILSKEHKLPREARQLFSHAGTGYQQAAT